jgi:uncharacterized protein with PIN domain
MKKNRNLIFRLSDEEWKIIHDNAELGSITMSDYIRGKIFSNQIVEKCPQCGSDLIDTVVSHNHISGGNPVQENQYSTYCPKCYWSKYAEDETLDEQVERRR